MVFGLACASMVVLMGVASLGRALQASAAPFESGSKAVRLTPTPLPTSALTPSAGLTPTAVPLLTGDETVLFRDSFDTYSNRWTRIESYKASVDYRDFALNLQVVSPGVSVWSVPDFALPLKFYTLLASVTFNQGSPDALFGFVLDYVDEGNFLALAVAINGTWQAGRYTDGVWQGLTPADADPIPGMESIKTVVLGVRVEADRLTLLVEGAPAAVVPLDTALSGSVFGVIAYAGRGFVDVSFDDVLVVDHAPNEVDRP